MANPNNETASLFSCINNFRQLKPYQEIFIGNKPDARDCDYLETAVVLHNWPSQWHSRYSSGYIQVRVNGKYANFDIAENSINGKKVYIFPDQPEVRKLCSEIETARQKMIAHAEDLIADGKELQKDGNWYGAVCKYKEAIELNPSDAQAHSLLGYALFRFDMKEAAISILSRGISLTSERWLLARMSDARGLAKSCIGDLNGARDDFKEALRHASRSPRILTHAGILEERAEAFGMAYTYALTALRYNPTYRPALLLKCRLEKNGHVKPLRVNLGSVAA